MLVEHFQLVRHRDLATVFSYRKHTNWFLISFEFTAFRRRSSYCPPVPMKIEKSHELHGTVR
jgi:hypothetical protein